MAALAGCSNGTGPLADLAGSWSGTATVNNQAYPITASFTFENDEYLAGQATVVDSAGTRTFSVRRAEVYSKVVAVDLQTIDLVYNLDLDGSSTDGTFTGSATMTTNCGQPQPCGWQGPLSMVKGPPVTPPITKPTKPTTPPDDTAAPTGTTPTDDTGPGTEDTSARR